MVLEPGLLLVAEPAMLDPNFRHAVVLLCDHDENGSFGLILNKPTNLQLAEVLAEPVDLDHPLFLGGPVQPDTLHFLHTYSAELPDAVIVGDDVAWGGPFDEVADSIRVGTLDGSRFRFFAGYAGWDGGQLADEVAEGSWYPIPATRGLVFDTPTEKLWRQLILSRGDDVALLVNFPEDPRNN